VNPAGATICIYEPDPKVYDGFIEKAKLAVFPSALVKVPLVMAAANGECVDSILKLTFMDKIKYVCSIWSM